jgi:hypothetical protein
MSAWKREKELFLISQEEIDRVDHLVGALNLAITEILEGQPIRDRRGTQTPAQSDYEDAVSEVLYRGDLLEDL